MKRSRHRLLSILVAISGALFLAACAGPKATPGESGRASGPGDAGAMGDALEGTSWVLAELAGRPSTGEALTARFESGRVFGTDGCNRYSASFSASGSEIAFGPGMSTQMACAPEVMAQAQSFREALENARRFRIVDGRLELLSSDGERLMIMAAQATSVVGTWEVIAFNNGREAVVGVLDQAPIEMTIASDGTVEGSAGCNRFNSTYEGEGAGFRFAPAATTRRFCPGEGVMEQEQAFLNALAMVATVRMEGDGLEFRTASDALALMLRRRSD